MKIEGITSSIGSIGTAAPKVEPQKEGGFGTMLSQMVSQVDNLTNDANTKVEGMITKKGDVQPHDAMIALEKADIAFQMMSTVKAKIIRAYEEVMRTQV